MFVSCESVSRRRSLTHVNWERIVITLFLKGLIGTGEIDWSRFFCTDLCVVGTEIIFWKIYVNGTVLGARRDLKLIALVLQGFEIRH